MRSPNPHIFVIIVIMVTSLFLAVYAAPDVRITVSTDREIYGSGDPVHILGTLTRDGNPVPGALVAVQVNDAQNNIISIRTCVVGSSPSAWSIDIVDFVPCDQFGNPKDTFRKGTLAYFKVVVKNLQTVSERPVIVTVNFYDSQQVSLGIAWIWTTVGPGKSFTYICSIPIPGEASIGTAYAYANAYNNWPKENGIAYCEEKAAAFTITDETTSSSTSSISQSTNQPGTFNLTFRLRKKHPLGDHTVYASYYQALATARFDVVWLLTDIDRNGVVDIIDVSIAARAYDTTPEDPRWNPKADIDGNGVINIVDISKVARDYGKVRR